MWSCDLDTVAHVTSTGVVTSVAKGKALVTASDKKNTAHFDKTEVKEGGRGGGGGGGGGGERRESGEG